MLVSAARRTPGVHANPLRNTLEMVDLASPVESLVDAGEIANPAADVSP